MEREGGRESGSGWLPQLKIVTSIRALLGLCCVAAIGAVLDGRVVWYVQVVPLVWECV